MGSAEQRGRPLSALIGGLTMPPPRYLRAFILFFFSFWRGLRLVRKVMFVLFILFLVIFFVLFADEGEKTVVVA